MPMRMPTVDPGAGASGGQHLGESIASQLQLTALGHEHERRTIGLELEGAEGPRVRLLSNPLRLRKPSVVT